MFYKWIVFYYLFTTAAVFIIVIFNNYLKEAIFLIKRFNIEVEYC